MSETYHQITTETGEVVHLTLKACPFCGGFANVTLVPKHKDDHRKPYVLIQCGDLARCHYIPCAHAATAPEAAERWNKLSPTRQRNDGTNAPIPSA